MTFNEISYSGFPTYSPIERTLMTDRVGAEIELDRALETDIVELVTLTDSDKRFLSSSIELMAGEPINRLSNEQTLVATHSAKFTKFVLATLQGSNRTPSNTRIQLLPLAARTAPEPQNIATWVEEEIEPFRSRNELTESLLFTRRFAIDISAGEDYEFFGAEMAIRCMAAISLSSLDVRAYAQLRDYDWDANFAKVCAD